MGTRIQLLNKMIDLMIGLSIEIRKNVVLGNIGDIRLVANYPELSRIG